MFSNRVRLPIRVLRPQFPEDKQTFTDAGGNDITLSTVIKKTYELNTDYLPESLHEKIVIALGHDNVSFEGEKYLGGINKDGPYEIVWDDTFPNNPLAPGKCTLRVTPFDASNSNCVSCEDVSGLNLIDDTFPDPLEEDSSANINAIANDDICCSPVTFTISSFNSDYLVSATIDDTGLVTVVTKTPLVAANGILLVTYRATCGSGSYDEADIFGNVNGSIEACLAPTDLQITDLLATSFHAAWTAPSPAPLSYHWEVLDADTLTIIQSGDTTDLFVDIAGLTASTAYIFQVRSTCEAGESNFIQADVTTNPTGGHTCGYYRVFPAAGGDPTPPHQGTITYLGCGGFYQSVHSDLFTPINICALQSAPGIYTDIHSTFTGIVITYLNDFQCGG